MAATNAVRTLGSIIERDGNWRFKAMLAAELPEHPLTHEQVGEAFLYLERNPEVKRYHLSKRSDFDPDAPEGLRHKTLAADPNRRIRPLAEGYDDAGYNEPTYARELAEDTTNWDTKTLKEGVSTDEYIGRLLTSTTAQEKDVLWREQLLDVVVQGAEEVQFIRDATNFVEVQTQQGDHPVRGDDVFAPLTSEGGGIEFDELDWSQANWNTEKRGLGAYITEELVDHALVDIIEENIRYLGRAVENSFNRIGLNELVDNANENVTFSTTATNNVQNTDPTFVFEARDAIVKDSWPEPDSIVMHNKFHLGFSTSSNNNLMFANRAGTQEYLQNATLPPVAGLPVANQYVAPDSVYNGGNTYDWSGSSGDRGAVVYVEDLMFTYMYRDLETKDFDDPIRDLEGANVRAQYDAALGQTDAACRIEET